MGRGPAMAMDFAMVGGDTARIVDVLGHDSPHSVPYRQPSMTRANQEARRLRPGPPKDMTTGLKVEGDVSTMEGTVPFSDACDDCNMQKGVMYDIIIIHIAARLKREEQKVGRSHCVCMLVCLSRSFSE